MTLRHYYYEIKKLHKDKVIIMTKTMTKNEINHNQDKKKYFLKKIWLGISNFVLFHNNDFSFISILYAIIDFFLIIMTWLLIIIIIYLFLFFILMLCHNYVFFFFLWQRWCIRIQLILKLLWLLSKCLHWLVVIVHPLK